MVLYVRKRKFVGSLIHESTAGSDLNVSNSRVKRKKSLTWSRSKNLSGPSNGDSSFPDGTGAFMAKGSGRMPRVRSTAAARGIGIYMVRAGSQSPASEYSAPMDLETTTSGSRTAPSLPEVEAEPSVRDLPFMGMRATTEVRTILEECPTSFRFMAAHPAGSATLENMTNWHRMTDSTIEADNPWFGTRLAEDAFQGTLANPAAKMQFRNYNNEQPEEWYLNDSSWQLVSHLLDGAGKVLQAWLLCFGVGVYTYS
jgi:hypothetical protein